MNGTYLIKAIDQSGRESANATSVVNAAAGIAELNVVETLSEASAFAGVMTDVWEYDGAVTLEVGWDFFDCLGEKLLDDFGEEILDGTGEAIGDGDIFGLDDFFLGHDGFEELGYYDFASGIDLGGVYVSRVSGSITASGVDYGDDLFSRTGFFSVDDYFGIADSSWAAEIEMRMTDDDPAGVPAWTDWASLALGDYSARGYEFRVRLESLSWGVSPNVTAASVSVDMPDRVVSENDLTVPVAGLSVVFTPAFKGLKGLGIAAQDMATGDYSVISSKGATGFDIIFRNAAGAAVQRTMDYVAAGYGRVQV